MRNINFKVNLNKSLPKYQVWKAGQRPRTYVTTVLNEISRYLSLLSILIYVSVNFIRQTHTWKCSVRVSLRQKQHPRNNDDVYLYYLKRESNGDLFIFHRHQWFLSPSCSSCTKVKCFIMLINLCPA